ncbi:hypothetical protein SKAU_G00356290 [Synaphobranchus kaupii]|uniref:Uncharacterized protein n=1 Tax=Synaphobranchus kaupii TaxID=118154 RepID=A0A9Q1EHD6_SYNKA|nr:hypothetical protein SKAU_G00356290 [Synaphobranchus kaupii]
MQEQRDVRSPSTNNPMFLIPVQLLGAVHQLTQLHTGCLQTTPIVVRNPKINAEKRCRWLLQWTVSPR